MGAEREDTDPNPKRVGTEPGLGKSSGQTPAAAAREPEEDELAPVDFDALHAALGDPLDFDDLDSNPIVEVGPGSEIDDLLDSDPIAPPGAMAPGPNAVRVGESSGRTNATYASGPHTIPPTRAPVEDLNAPAVIVSSADTVPSAPPHMTVPLQQTPGHPQYPGGPIVPHGGHPMHGPGSNPAMAASGPHPAAPGHPSSGPHPTAAAGGPAVAYPRTPPQAFVPSRAGQMTMRMPDRPLNPRRGKTPTIVVRPRGPSAKQKLIAFMAALLLCTACGIAVIIVLKPKLLGVDTEAAPSASTSGPPSASGALGSASGGASSSAAPSASASSSSAASASSSAKVKPLKPPPPRP